MANDGKLFYDETGVSEVKKELETLKLKFEMIMDDAMQRMDNVLNGIARTSLMSSLDLPSKGRKIKNASNTYYDAHVEAIKAISDAQFALATGAEFGVDAFGMIAPFGSGTFGASPFGSGTFGASPLGSGTFGSAPFGTGSFTIEKEPEKEKPSKDGGDKKDPATTVPNYYEGANSVGSNNGTHAIVSQPVNIDTKAQTADDGAVSLLEEKLKAQENALKKQLEEMEKFKKELEEKTKQSTIPTPTSTPTPTPTSTPTSTPTPTSTSTPTPIPTSTPTPTSTSNTQPTDASNVATDVSGDNGNGYIVNDYRYVRPQGEAVAIPDTNADKADAAAEIAEGSTASVVGSTKDLFKSKKTGGTTTTKLPSTSSTTSSSSSSKGFNPIPLAIGLGAAVAGGVGVKMYKDHKNNSEFDDANEDSFTNGNRFWSEEDPNVINSEQNELSNENLFEESVSSPSYEAMSNGGGSDSWSMEEAESEPTTETAPAYDLLGDN